MTQQQQQSRHVVRISEGETRCGRYIIATKIFDAIDEARTQILEWLDSFGDYTAFSTQSAVVPDELGIRPRIAVTAMFSRPPVMDEADHLVFVRAERDAVVSWIMSACRGLTDEQRTFIARDIAAGYHRMDWGQPSDLMRALERLEREGREAVHPTLLKALLQQSGLLELMTEDDHQP